MSNGSGWYGPPGPGVPPQGYGAPVPRRGPIPRPRIMLVGNVLGLVGAAANLLVAALAGTFLAAVTAPSLGETSSDDSAGWNQIFFGFGVFCLVVALFYALAVVMLVLTLQGRTWARTFNLVLASITIPYVLFLLVLMPFSLLGSLDSGTWSGSGPGELVPSLLLQVPSVLYVLGSFLLLAPSATRWLRARSAPPVGPAPDPWSRGPQGYRQF